MLMINRKLTAADSKIVYDTELIDKLAEQTIELIKSSYEVGSADDVEQGLVQNCAIKALKAFTLEMLAEDHEPVWLDNEDVVIRQVVARLNGLGGIQQYLDDESIENIDINGYDNVFVTRFDGTKQKVLPIAKSDNELIEIIKRAATRIGLNERRFDKANPQLDLRLSDGSRLSALMDVCQRPCVSIRKHRLVDISLDKEVELGMCTQECGDFLSLATKSGLNILIAGRTNSGKTTLLRALINEIPPGERIITIEQSLELGIDKLQERHPDCIALESRLPNTEGVGEITMADLVRRSLRMNPDRVIVGETLGPEIVALLNTMSQGFGSLATIHADSPHSVFPRIASYAIQAPERLSLEATNLLIASAIDLVIYVSLKQFRSTDCDKAVLKRFISSIREVVSADGHMVVSNEIYKSRNGEDGVFTAPLTKEIQEKITDYRDVSGDNMIAKTGVM